MMLRAKMEKLRIKKSLVSLVLTTNMRVIQMMKRSTWTNQTKGSIEWRGDREKFMFLSYGELVRIKHLFVQLWSLSFMLFIQRCLILDVKWSVMMQIFYKNSGLSRKILKISAWLSILNLNLFYFGISWMLVYWYITQRLLHSELHFIQLRHLHSC